MKQEYTISPLGDSALLIHFENRIDENTNKMVLLLFHQLQKLALVGVTDICPAYGSLAVYYDVMSLRQKNQTAFSVIKEKIEALLKEENSEVVLQSRNIRIPVCYAKKFAPDLEIIAIQKNLSEEEVIQLHIERSYRVYMIGFLPGFAYMGKVEERIATPRKSNPSNVGAGSVGIAGEQTGIYPLASPGGWNIIGKTPQNIFNKTKKETVLLQPGDVIQFYSITEDEFENYQGWTS
ncbi:MAG: 5-oxoprolinase subunit PxpB [Bacteroidota bacterium]|nr:5-oxoprolinase subunit PxpB [Bacteroidota bacterium]